MRFLIFGRPVGLKKHLKRIPKVSEKEAWYRSIIAVEPGNNRTRIQNQYGVKYNVKTVPVFLYAVFML